MKLNCIDKKEELDRTKDFFQDIRFYMGKSVLDGMMGQAYVDDFINVCEDESFGNGFGQ